MSIIFKVLTHVSFVRESIVQVVAEICAFVGSVGSMVGFSMKTVRQMISACYSSLFLKVGKFYGLYWAYTRYSIASKHS